MSPVSTALTICCGSVDCCSGFYLIQPPVTFLIPLLHLVPISRSPAYSAEFGSHQEKSGLLGISSGLSRSGSRTIRVLILGSWCLQDVIISFGKNRIGSGKVGMDLGFSKTYYSLRRDSSEVRRCLTSSGAIVSVLK